MGGGGLGGNLDAALLIMYSISITHTQDDKIVVI